MVLDLWEWGQIKAPHLESWRGGGICRVGGTWAGGRLVGSLCDERGCGRWGRRDWQAGMPDTGAPTSRIGRGLWRAD